MDLRQVVIMDQLKRSIYQYADRKPQTNSVHGKHLGLRRGDQNENARVITVALAVPIR